MRRGWVVVGLVVAASTAAGGGAARPAPDGAHAGAAITLDTVEFREARRNGRPAGMALHITGSADDRGAIEVDFEPGGHHAIHFLRAAGPINHDIFMYTLPSPTPLPGDYTLTFRLRESGDPQETRVQRRATLPPAPEGVVSRAWLSRTKAGPPAPTHGTAVATTEVYLFPRNTRRVWAHFEYAVRPTYKPIGVRWLTPRLRTIGVARKPNAPTVDSFVLVTVPKGKLGKGNWRCWLQAGGVIAKRLQFKIG